MKRCPKCNQNNEDFNSVCINCEYPLEFVEYSGSVDNSGMNNSYQAKKTNGLAIASMVLGIVSVPLICCCYVGILTGILAVIFGFIARKNIRESQGTQEGMGMALAGIIIGFVVVGCTLVLILLYVAVGFQSDMFTEGYWEQLLEEAKRQQQYQ
jgi:RsiW-degrading membrane proteinase PrsW (M82 family)